MSADASERAAAAAALGAGPLSASDRTALRNLVATDPDPTVRAVALGALSHGSEGDGRAWLTAARDPAASVRRRAAETAPAFGAAVAADALLALLDDGDAWVAEAAAFALGERPDAATTTVDALTRCAMHHADPLVREAAVAALGALGDPAGLDAVLHACHDKPAIRRRAVLALAAFEGDAVEDALTHARTDPDWQVRQNAEDLR